MICGCERNYRSGHVLQHYWMSTLPTLHRSMAPLHLLFAVTARSRGSTRICPSVDSTSYIRATAHHHQSSSSQCRRARCWDRSCLSCTWQMSHASSNDTVSVYNSMPMTPGSAVYVIQAIRHHCRDLGDCMSSMASWMFANRLQLNVAETEFMWYVPPRRRHQLPPDQLAVGSISVAPVDSVRDFGVIFNLGHVNGRPSHSARQLMFWHSQTITLHLPLAAT